MPDRLVPVVDRVEWFEGMLLAPQHFQLLGSRVDSLVAWQTLAAAPFSWGVRRLVFDEGLLAAGAVRVLSLDAIMPDGTAVSYAADVAQLGRLELSLAPFAERLASSALEIYLTLPVASSVHGEAEMRRFRSVAGEPVDGGYPR